MMRKSVIYKNPDFKIFAQQMVADSGYRGDCFLVTQPHPETQIPTKVNLDLHTCYTNHELKSIRCQIEQQFCILKKTFKVLSEPWAMKREYHDPASRVCCCLHNLRNDWENYHLD